MPRKTIVEVTMTAAIEVDATDLASFKLAAEEVSAAQLAAQNALHVPVLVETKTKTVKAE